MADKKISELNAKDLQPEDTLLAVGPTEDYRASASSVGRYVLEDYAGTQFAGKNQAISSAIGAASLSGLGDGTVTGAIKEVNTRIDTKAQEVNARIDAKVKESVDQSAITYVKKADMTEVVKELASADTKADTSIKALQSADEAITKKIHQNTTQISGLQSKISQVEATASSTQSTTQAFDGRIHSVENIASSCKSQISALKPIIVWDHIGRSMAEVQNNVNTYRARSYVDANWHLERFDRICVEYADDDGTLQSVMVTSPFWGQRIALMIGVSLPGTMWLKTKHFTVHNDGLREAKKGSQYLLGDAALPDHGAIGITQGNPIAILRITGYPAIK